MSVESICGEGFKVERLETFGWNGFFEAHFRSDDFERMCDSRVTSLGKEPGMCPARVASDFRETYRLFSEHGELKGEVTGRLRHLALTKEDLPAVGDWVAIKPMLEERKAAIKLVLPRRSCFVRKEAGLRSRGQIVAANIDTVFVVVALNNDFNLRRVERYTTAVWESGAAPVIVLSKSDLCIDPRGRAGAVEGVAFGVPVHTISAVAGEGLAELGQYVTPGRTVALVGSSGAGKSTLINKLFGSEIRRTREIRVRDDRGMHATATRDLILLPGGALVLDTPGMRELQLWGAERGFTQTFDDIDSLSSECRFSDCAHRAEPGCAVRDAVESGRIDRERIESFDKIRKETEFLDLRRQYGAKRAEKKRWKKGAEMMKKHGNRKGGL